MFKNFDAAVKKLVLFEGKSEEIAYAICISNYMKELNSSPFISKEEIIGDSNISTNLKKLLESMYSHAIESQIACLDGFAGAKKVKILEKEVTGSVAYVP